MSDGWLPANTYAAASVWCWITERMSPSSESSATRRSWNSSRHTTVSPPSALCSPSGMSSSSRSAARASSAGGRTDGLSESWTPGSLAVTPRRADQRATTRRGSGGSSPNACPRRAATSATVATFERSTRTALCPTARIDATCASIRLVFPNRRGAARRTAIPSDAARCRPSSSSRRSIRRAGETGP